MERIKEPGRESGVGSGARSPMERAGIEVRHCTTLAEFAECVRLQQSTWGEDIVVPSAMFVVAQETGGQILGAFEGSRLVGFTMALAAIHGLTPFLHSHMTAVLPEFQNRGVGRWLKLLQREDALARGIRLVEWTFDPLDLKNAYFNLVRLGAVARRFIPNCYGITDSPLHSGLPTDRLLAEWWLDSPRVQAILEGNDNLAVVQQSSATQHIRVPADIGQLRNKDRAAAARVQGEIREQFQHWYGREYVAIGLAPNGPTVDYLLQPTATVAPQVFPEPSGG
jgi:predicted GNAT superfamily acetyltransferase